MAKVLRSESPEVSRAFAQGGGASEVSLAQVRPVSTSRDVENRIPVMPSIGTPDAGRRTPDKIHLRPKQQRPLIQRQFLFLVKKAFHAVLDIAQRQT